MAYKRSSITKNRSKKYKKELLAWSSVKMTKIPSNSTNEKILTIAATHVANHVFTVNFSVKLSQITLRALAMATLLSLFWIWAHHILDGGGKRAPPG